MFKFPIKLLNYWTLFNIPFNLLKLNMIKSRIQLIVNIAFLNLHFNCWIILNYWRPFNFHSIYWIVELPSIFHSIYWIIRLPSIFHSIYWFFESVFNISFKLLIYWTLFNLFVIEVLNFVQYVIQFIEMLNRHSILHYEYWNTVRAGFSIKF